MLNYKRVNNDSSRAIRINFSEITQVYSWILKRRILTIKIAKFVRWLQWQTVASLVPLSSVRLQPSVDQFPAELSTAKVGSQKTQTACPWRVFWKTTTQIQHFLCYRPDRCATAPCKTLHGAIRIRSLDSNIVPHLAGNTVMLQGQERHWVTNMWQEATLS